MTIEERDICLSMGNSILSKDLTALAASLYPDEDLQSMTVEEFSLVELFTLLKRVIKQLVSKLKTNEWKVLPDKFTDPHTDLTGIKQGAVLVTEQITYINDALEDGSPFATWVPETLLLTRYEMHYGFWDRSTTRVHNPEDLNLIRTQEEAELLIQLLTASMREAEDIPKQLRRSITELDEFRVLKTTQFASLEKTLDSASQSLTAVRDFEKEASTSNGKITTLLEQSDKTLDASRKKIAQDRKVFNELDEQIRLLADSSAQKVNELSVYGELFDGIIKNAREKEQHILDQDKEIMRLIGHAADGRLATAFNDRQKELNSSVNWWRNVNIGVIIVAICWVVFVFYNTPSQDKAGINWLILLANIVRTSPAFLLVFFCQAQYTKERNIQEEYAFKAAVSRTVTSYADMIGTSEVNERVKMLIETIQRLYLPPVLGKPLKPFSIRSKDFAQAAKSMAETAQSLKTAVTDILPNTKSDKPDKSA